MKIIYKTNIDVYENYWFPKNHVNIPPSVGHRVSVSSSVKSFFIDRRLPTSLEVVKVTWEEDCIICELHYSELDFKTFKENNINPFP